MSNRIHTLAVIATGQFTRDRTGGDLALNPPPAGHAWVPGLHSPRTHRVIWPTDDFGDLQLQAPLVVAQTPAPPAETEWVSWQWDAPAERYREVPKLLLLQVNARLPFLDMLTQLDDKTRRPVGEIAEAQALGQPLPAEAVARLVALNADKQLVRDRLTALAATADAEQLAALVATPLPLSN